MTPNQARRKNVGEMDQDRLLREIEALRERLSRLDEFGLRINESLEFETVLQGVLDDAGRIQDFRYSGLTPGESRQFAEFPNGMLFEGVGGIYVGEKEREFAAEDEETLVMVASQAALVTAIEYRMLLELSADARRPLTH